MSDGVFSIWSSNSLIPLPLPEPSNSALEKFNSCQSRSATVQKTVIKLCCGNSKSEEGYFCSSLGQYITAHFCEDCVYYAKKSEVQAAESSL